MRIVVRPSDKTVPVILVVYTVNPNRKPGVLVEMRGLQRSYDLLLMSHKNRLFCGFKRFFFGFIATFSGRGVCIT